MESQSQLARDAELMAKELEDSSGVSNSEINDTEKSTEPVVRFQNYPYGAGESISVNGDMLSSFSNDVTAPNSSERQNDFSTRNLTSSHVHSWDEFHHALVSANFPGISPLLPNQRKYSSSELPWNSLLNLLQSILEDNKAKTGRLGALQGTLSDTAKTIMELEKQLKSGTGSDTVTVRNLEKKIQDLEEQLRKSRVNSAPKVVDESLVMLEREVERLRSELETSRESPNEDSKEWERKYVAATNQLERERKEMEELKKHTKKVEGDQKHALDEVTNVRVEMTSEQRNRSLTQLPDVAEWSLAKQTIAGLRAQVAQHKETEDTLRVCLQRVAAAEQEVGVLTSQLTSSEKEKKEMLHDLKRYQSVLIKQTQEDLDDASVPALLTNKDAAAEVQVLRENVMSMRKGMEMFKNEQNKNQSEKEELKQVIVSLQEEQKQRPLHSDYDNARKIAIDAQSHATDSYLSHQHSNGQLQTQLDDCQTKLRGLERDNEALREALRSRQHNTDLSDFVDEQKTQLEKVRSSSQEDSAMYQAMVDDLQEKLGQAETMKNKLQKALNDRPSKEDVVSLRDKQVMLEKEVASLREHKKKQDEQADERIQELLREKQVLTEQLDELRKQYALRPSREEFNTVESENAELKKKISDMEGKLVHLEQALQEQSEHADKTRNSLEEELIRRNEEKQLVEKLKNRLNQCGSLEGQLMEARRQIVKLTEELNTLKQKLATCPKPEDLVSAESKIHRLESELDDAYRSKEIKDTENEIIIVGLREKVAELDKKLQQQRMDVTSRPSSIEWRDKKNEISALREAYANEKLLQVQQITRADAECSAALSRVKYLENENKSLVRELNSRPSVEEHDALRVEIRSIQNKLIDNIVDNSPVKKKHVTDDNTEYVKNVNAQKEHVDILQKALEERPSVQQWDQLKMKLIVLEDQLSKLRTDSQSIEAQARSDGEVAKNTLFEMQKRAEHAETLIKILEKRPSEEMLLRVTKENERLTKIVKASQQIERTLHAMKAELETRPSTEQWQEASTQLQNLQSQLMNSDSEKKHALNNADHALATREEALRQLEIAKEELYKAAEAKKEQNAKVDQTITQLHAEVTHLKRQLAELHEKNITNEVKLGVLPSTEQWVRAQALLSSMSSNEARFEQDLARLKKQIHESKVTIQQLQELSENAPTIEDLAMAETVVQKLRAEVATLQHNCNQRTKEAEGAKHAFYELKHAVESGVATTNSGSTTTSNSANHHKPSEAFFVNVNTHSTHDSDSKSVQSNNSHHQNVSRTEAQKIVSRLCILLRISHPELLEGTIKRTITALKELQQQRTSTATNQQHTSNATGTPLSIEVLKRIRKHLDLTYGPVASTWSDNDMLEALQGCMQGILRPLEHIQALANVPMGNDMVEIAPNVTCSRRDQVAYTLTGIHLQRLLGVAAVQGLVPKINEMYLYVGQTNTASALLRDLLQLKEKDSLGVVVRAVKLLIEEKKGQVPSPMNHVRAESDGYSLLLDSSEEITTNSTTNHIHTNNNPHQSNYDTISNAPSTATTATSTGTTGTTGSTQARLGALATLENQIAALNVQQKLSTKPAAMQEDDDNTTNDTNDTFLDTFDSYSEILPSSSTASVSDVDRTQD